MGQVCGETKKNYRPKKKNKLRQTRILDPKNLKQIQKWNSEIHCYFCQTKISTKKNSLKAKDLDAKNHHSLSITRIDQIRIKFEHHIDRSNENFEQICQKKQKKKKKNGIQTISETIWNQLNWAKIYSKSFSHSNYFEKKNLYPNKQICNKTKLRHSVTISSGIFFLFHFHLFFFF